MLRTGVTGGIRGNHRVHSAGLSGCRNPLRRDPPAKNLGAKLESLRRNRTGPLDLEPIRRSNAGEVQRVQPLADDAFQAQCKGLLIQPLAFGIESADQQDRRQRLGEQQRKPTLPFYQRLGHDVYAVVNEKIERAIGLPALAQVQAIEVASAKVIEHAHFAVEDLVAGDC